MVWFKTDDKLHDNRKTRRALRGTDVRRDPAAMGLWVLAGSWCAEALNETGDPDPGGWVPADELDRWADNAAELAQRLVDAELWHPETLNGEAGFRFHDWCDYQPTRDSIRTEREAARARMARARAGKGSDGVRPNTQRSSDNPVPVPVPLTTPAPATPGEPDPFDTFWTAYPRKIGKAAAAKAYAKATKDTTPDAILAGLSNAVAVWTASRTEDRFIPHASTWLNAGRWTDEQPALPGTPTAGPTRPTKTLAQCDGTDCPGSQHEWTDARGRNAFVCQGA